MASLPNTAEMEMHAQDAEMVSNTSLCAYDMYMMHLSHSFLSQYFEGGQLGYRTI